MGIESSIRKKVSEALNPQWLELENESHSHNVPPGSETHFRLVVVSQVFDGLSRVERQRRVYELLNEERAQGLHALALWTYTPAEWQAKGQASPDSPECRGGRGK